VQTVWFVSSELSTHNSVKVLPIDFAPIDRAVKKILDPTEVFGSIPD
jgi:hypothetical protein